MHRNVKNKITIKINPTNERIYSTHQATKKQSTINSANSLRSSNESNAPREFKVNTTNKYSICNTSPNTKITKHLNLTRTIQSIPRSSHSLSREGIISNKL